MATGDFWDVSNPTKPVGPFDPDDVIHIPFDFAEWLAEQGTTYDSHDLEVADGLASADVDVQDGVIVVSIQASGSPALVIGAKYSVTCQLTAADGQKKSQTVYLKIKQL